MWQFPGLESLSWMDMGLLVAGGILTGIINTLAGSGSLITLPLLMYICGLSPTVANGTNRLGAIIPGLLTLWGLHRSGKMVYTGSLWLVIPSAIGAVIGSYTAISLDEKIMQYCIAGLMIFMLVVLLVKPERWLRESQASVTRNRHPLTVIAFVLIGFYGGFIQVGSGLFVLAVLVVFAHYSLTAANGMKALTLTLFNVPALFIFAANGQVNWMIGLLMAGFQSLGAWLALRFMIHIPSANVWVYRLLILIVVVSASKVLGLWEWALTIMSGG